MTSNGISVLGTPEEISKLRHDHKIDACVLAMPSASGKRLQELYKLLLTEGLKVGDRALSGGTGPASGRGLQVTKDPSRASGGFAGA